MRKEACPRCGVPALQPGASKCPACRAWIVEPPARPLGLGALWAVAAALITAGAGIGAVAARIADAPSVPWLDAGHPAPPASAVPVSAAAPPASAALPAPGASDPTPAKPTAPPAEVLWGDPRTLRVGAPPIDVAVSEDDQTVFVLCQDGTLRALSAETGREERRLALPGRPTRIRLLGGHYLAGLGAAGAFPVVDITRWTVAKLDLGGAALDAVAAGDERAILAASADAPLVARFAPPAPGKPASSWRRDGRIFLPRPPTRLYATPFQLAILAPAARPGELGSIDLLDPRATPFGAARLVFPIALDPDAAPLPAPGGIAVVDRGGTQLLRVSPPERIEIAPIAATPRGGVIGAFRLRDRYIVIIDAVGTATVVSDPGGAAVATLALGAAPSDAALTPDGLALLVALGDGPRGRGAETVVVSGDPPALSARLATGAGSQAVSVGGAGRRAAVAAFWTRSVAVLEPR